MCFQVRLTEHSPRKMIDQLDMCLRPRRWYWSSIMVSNQPRHVCIFLLSQWKIWRSGTTGSAALERTAEDFGMKISLNILECWVFCRPEPDFEKKILLWHKNSKRPNFGQKMFQFFACFATFGPERGWCGRFFWFSLTQNFMTNIIG